MRILLCSGVALVVYSLTLADGLQGGDAGELATAVYRVTVAHPPGYPLYVLLGKLVTLVPIGSVIARLNAFSALCMAGAVYLLGRAVSRHTKSEWAGVGACLLFAFSPLVWTWATQAEVFALLALCAAALLAIFVEPLTRRTLSLGAFVFGLGLGNHHTLILLGVPLAIALIVRSPWKDTAHAFAGFALGLCVYAQLPLGHSEVGWGATQTLSGFFRHLTRAEYGSFSLAGSRGASGVDGLLIFFADEARQLLFVGVVLAVLGLWRAPVAVIVAWVLSSIVFLLLARFPVSSPLFVSVLARFWILPLLIACFFVGRGLARLPQRLAVGSCVALAFVQLVLSRPPRTTPLVQQYANAVLAELPLNAVLLSRGDLLHNALRHALTVEGQRPDVLLLDQELMTYEWYVAGQTRLVFPGRKYHPHEPHGFSLARFLDVNAGREFYLIGGLKPGDPSLKDRYFEIGHGLSTRLVREPFCSRFDGLERTPFALAVATADPWQAALKQEYAAAVRRAPPACAP